MYKNHAVVGFFISRFRYFGCKDLRPLPPSSASRPPGGVGPACSTARGSGTVVSSSSSSSSSLVSSSSSCPSSCSSDWSPSRVWASGISLPLFDVGDFCSAWDVVSADRRELVWARVCSWFSIFDPNLCTFPTVDSMNWDSLSGDIISRLTKLLGDDSDVAEVLGSLIICRFREVAVSFAS